MRAQHQRRTEGLFQLSIQLVSHVIVTTEVRIVRLRNVIEEHQPAVTSGIVCLRVAVQLAVLKKKR
jgi:hypothetical protein